MIVATESFTGAEDPIDDIRSIALTFFDAIAARPWLGAYFMRDTGVQPNGLRLYDRIGQQVLRLGLTTRQSFHAVSAVTGYVLGIAADLGQEPPREVLEGEVSRDATSRRGPTSGASSTR